MAQARITKIMDGPRNAVFHIFIEGDGSGELADEIIVDPGTSFDPALPSSPTLTIDRFWYELTGFDAKLEFEYLASDTPVWQMAGNGFADVDFSCFGGLKDRSAPADGSGKLKLSTNGLDGGDRGVIVLKLRKD